MIPDPSQSDAGLDQTSQNIEAVLAFHRHEEDRISRSQRILEQISHFIGRPAFFGIILLIVSLWILSNELLHINALAQYDPMPYFALQGIVALGSLLTATAVLIKQNRLGKVAELRAHLDLKVMLLTEQKAAKVIDLLEELRRDLPNVKNRPDADAAALIRPMDPDLVRATLDERKEVDDILAEPGA